MYSNVNYYQPQQPQQQTMPIRQQPLPQMPIAPQQLGLKGRPVSSIEEVRASAIDFDGSVFFFPDLANKRIYTKQIGMDGSAILCMYEMKELPRETNSNMAGYITRDEFDSAMAQIKTMFDQAQSQQQPTIQSLPQEQQKPQFNF